jgi:cytochrome c2
MTQERVKRISRLPVYVALGILVLVAAAFLFELLTFDPRVALPVPEGEPSVAELESRAAVLAERGDPSRADQHIETYGCFACHRIGAENDIAPAFVGIAERAGERKPDLSAAAYLYESILYPAAYTVDGYPASMPQDYPTRISENDLADLIAYLLTPDAQ